MIRKDNHESNRKRGDYKTGNSTCAGMRNCRLMKAALLSFDANEVEIQVSTD
jgi:hypothetical protein